MATESKERRSVLCSPVHMKLMTKCLHHHSLASHAVPASVLSVVGQGSHLDLQCAILRGELLVYTARSETDELC